METVLIEKFKAIGELLLAMYTLMKTILEILTPANITALE